jgi:HEAT repeat protein
MALVRGEPDERWMAARALAVAPGGVDALREALATESDARVCEAIFTSLVRSATPEAAEAVAACLRSDDAARRTAALDALRAMPAAVIEAKLSKLLVDADPDVRLLACEIARGVTAEAGAQALSALLDRESEANVCTAAIDVLAEIGGPEALPALRRCAARFDHEPFLGFAIKIAAERIAAQGGNR